MNQISDTDHSTNSSDPNVQILSVHSMLTKTNLCIPDYQRPYKWGIKNIGQLLSDIGKQQDKPSYRLGTIVLHRNRADNEYDTKLEIVDGQQRLVTLSLLVKALLSLPNNETNTELRREINFNGLDEEGRLFAPNFGSTVSPHTHYHLWHNYRELERRVMRPEANAKFFNFLFACCEFICIELNDISEAFQFFDSQNARGKDLRPHDLLKAYHLRKFGTTNREIKKQTVGRWENTPEDELSTLFNTYLYRIRCWSQGLGAPRLTKQGIALFKGIDVGTQRARSYPFAKPLEMLDALVNRYNADPIQCATEQFISFPHQLDQTIINGRRFFEWVGHYQRQGFHRELDNNRICAPALRHEELSDNARGILKTLAEYNGRTRTGDRYVRSIFDCLVMFYIDKFGSAELSVLIEKAFIWAYRLRLKNKAVRYTSMNNHVCKNNLFERLRHATHPRDLIDVSLRAISYEQIDPPTGLCESPNQEESVWGWFKTLGYGIQENGD